MTFDYAPLAQTATKTLKEFGRQVTLRNKSLPTYDPAQGTTSTSPPSEGSRWAAIFDFAEGQTEERGNSVQSTDKRAIMDAGVKPSTEDELIDGADVYEILSVGEVRPGTGAAIIYKLHLRG